jgi:glycerophosphoryl diester phosphodiesterase
MKPWNIAHRGGAQLQPENTLAAFHHALALGCDGAELDVQLTHDDRLVVFHDFHLKGDLCRNAAGVWLNPPLPRINEMSLPALQRIDVGRAQPNSAYERTHPNVAWRNDARIPLFTEVVDAVRSVKSFRLFVELKSCFSTPGISAAPEMLAMHAVQSVHVGDMLDRTVFVSFDWRGLKAVKRQAPQAQCWFTTLPQSWFAPGTPPPKDDPPGAHALEVLRHWAVEGKSPWAAGFDAMRHGGSIVRAIKAAGGDGWFAYHSDVTAETVAAAHALGLKIGAWTVNDAEDMRALDALGIDAICTDRPDVLKTILSPADQPTPSNSAVER